MFLLITGTERRSAAKDKMRNLFRNEHAVILYYINVFMSPFTLSLHLFFDRPLFLRRAVDCHYKTRQTDTRQTGKTRQTVARQTGIASKWDAPNWTASNRNASKRTRQTGLTANFYPMKIVDTWNNLPANVAEAPTIGSFKRRLTKYRRSLVIS